MMMKKALFALVAVLALSAGFASADDNCVKLSNKLQEPGSPCRNFVAQIREQQKGIAESTCANPVTVSTKPTAQCCELALTFTPCKCDDDVARVSGRMLAIATYRATQFACQGKCVEPQSVGCKG